MLSQSFFGHVVLVQPKFCGAACEASKLASCYRKHRRIQAGFPSRLIHRGPLQGFISPHLLSPVFSRVSFLQHSLVNIHQSFVPSEFIPGPSAGFLSSCTHPLVFIRFRFLQISSLGLQQSFAPTAIIPVLKFYFQPGFFLQHSSHRDSTGFLSFYTHPQAFSRVPSSSIHP